MTTRPPEPHVKELKQSAERFIESDLFEGNERALARRNGTGFYEEQARSVPIYHKCDVLVVGGGPAGCAAALAAARTGAEVVLLERYNHLGGLSTGGLVIWIDRMTDWDGRQVVRGFAEDIFARLPPEAVAGPKRTLWGSRDEAKSHYWGLRTAAFHGVVCWSPTIDPENLKLISQELLLENGVRLVFHSWAALPIVESGTVQGVLFESKAGRQALHASVVVDTTGDGDVFARAGAAFEQDIEEGDVHHSMNTGFLLGGVDMNRWLEFRSAEAEQFAELSRLGRETIGYFQMPYVSWRNDQALFLGPRQAGFSGLDVDDMTEVEIRSHRLMRSHCDFFRRHAPGFENAFLLHSAPQLGVRHTRRLAGVSRIERKQWSSGQPVEDEIGVSPSLSLKFPALSVPYGALVPRRLDGLLAGGRHISCDANSHGFMREIPQCWLTGQAAGVAAGIAANRALKPRHVDVSELQSELRKQGVYLHDALTSAHADEVVDG